VHINLFVNHLQTNANKIKYSSPGGRGGGKGNEGGGGNKQR